MTDIADHRTFPDLPDTFKGTVLRPDDPEYLEAKQLWSSRKSEQRPTLIAQVTDVEDVVTVIKHAAAHGGTVAVRGGGHGVDCAAMADGAVVVDMSLMKAISVDPDTGQVTIQAGVQLGEMDAASQEHGLVVPAGVVTDTGAGGLTLGGGIGHLTRRFGATVDNLLSVQVVTTDGRVLTASADENADLFWGLRGAGHNLAVATSLTYQAHRVGPEVISGLLVYAAENAAPMFDRLDDVLTRAPRELTLALLFLPAPPLPGLPDKMIGTPILVVLVVWTGPLDEFDQAVEEFRSLAQPLADMVGPSTWLQANSIVDAFEPRGRRQYLLGGYFPGVNADIARIAVDRINQAPPPTPGLPSCLITLPVLGGALLDRHEDATAFSRTGAEWLYEIAGQWDGSEADTAYHRWVEDTMSALQGYASTNAYVNLTADRGGEWLRGAYGTPEKWQRLVALKQEWDPTNLLAHNKNIARAAGGDDG